MAKPSDLRASTRKSRDPLEIMRRFWNKVVFGHGPDACWLWASAGSGLGYGRFHARGQVMAHRFSYEALVGPIPDGLTIDHLCRNRACVNPAHMEPVTTRENTLRGEGVSARASRDTYRRKHANAG